MIKKALTLLLLYLSAFLFIKTIVEPQFYVKCLEHSAFWYFIGTFFLMFLLFFFRLKSGNFYTTLRHELCHWFFALLCLNKPEGLMVRQDGSGFYNYRGKRNYLITLAPYFFPLISYTLLLLRLFFSSPELPYYLLCATALAFDLGSMKGDYHTQQSDWQKNGILFSIQFSILLLLIFLTNLFLLLFTNLTIYIAFIKAVYLNLLSLF